MRETTIELVEEKTCTLAEELLVGDFQDDLQKRRYERIGAVCFSKPHSESVREFKNLSLKSCNGEWSGHAGSFPCKLTGTIGQGKETPIKLLEKNLYLQSVLPMIIVLCYNVLILSRWRPAFSAPRLVQHRVQDSHQHRQLGPATSKREIGGNAYVNTK